MPMVGTRPVPKATTTDKASVGAAGGLMESAGLRMLVPRLLHRLAALNPRPTIVMIAHRAESLARCDQIATIVQGRLLSAEIAAA